MRRRLSLFPASALRAFTAAAQRFIALAQHRIGLDQAKPSIDVGAVLGHALRKPRDHAFDHAVALGRRHLRGSGDLAGIRARGRSSYGRRRLAGWARGRATGSGGLGIEVPAGPGRAAAGLPDCRPARRGRRRWPRWLCQFFRAPDRSARVGSSPGHRSRLSSDARPDAQPSPRWRRHHVRLARPAVDGAVATIVAPFSSTRASAFLTIGSHSAPSGAPEISAVHCFTASSRRPSCLALRPR